VLTSEYGGDEDDVNGLERIHTSARFSEFQFHDLSMFLVGPTWTICGVGDENVCTGRALLLLGCTPSVKKKNPTMYVLLAK
jgi:hypothetical protein